MSPRGHSPAVDAARSRVDRRRLAELRTGFDGEVIEPGDPGYDTARLVWNAMIDRHPALIVRPAGTVDVARAVEFGRENGLEIAVKGGGHGAAGLATVDAGLMIDLGAMHGVRVDARRRRALVQGGARLVDIDRETSVHGLAVPAGVNFDTGVAGLTLGGGYGWLGRLHGLSSDNLESAEVVTADGEVVTADSERDAELLWGLRGGGGNFGIVTWFEFRAHPVPATVHALDLIFDPDAALELIFAFREFAADLPRTSTAYMGIQEASPTAGVPDEAMGGPLVTMGLVAIDETADLSSVVAPLRRVKAPWAEVPWSGTFRGLQRLSSDAPGARRRRYWRAHYVSEVSDAFVRALTAIDPARPFISEVELFQVGGAVMDLPADATAFSHRDALFDVLAIGYWDDPSEDETRMGALRAAAARLEPFSTGVYVNNLLDDDEARIRDAFRDSHFERLQALKTRMDPDNVFHRNANIPPLATKSVPREVVPA